MSSHKNETKKIVIISKSKQMRFKQTTKSIQIRQVQVESYLA